VVEIEQKTKSILKGVGAFVVGGVLVTLGVAVWMDGNTGFGGGLGAVGILIVVAWLSSALQNRKKSRETQAEDHQEGEKQ
jgi:hypothetical protein